MITKTLFNGQTIAIINTEDEGRGYKDTDGIIGITDNDFDFIVLYDDSDDELIGFVSLVQCSDDDIIRTIIRRRRSEEELLDTMIWLLETVL